MAKVESRYNILYEKCFRTDIGDMSLRDLFTKGHLIKSLAGTPAQNFALMNLLRSITEDAAQPIDDAMWYRTFDTYIKTVIAYLESRKDDFWLYHNSKPFLQDASLDEAEVLRVVAKLKAEKKAKKAAAQGNNADTDAPKKGKEKSATSKSSARVDFSIGGLDFTTAQESAGVAFAMRSPNTYTDAEIVNHLITHMSFYTISNGRRRTDLSVGLGMSGLLHTMFCGSNLKETIWLNTIPSDKMTGVVRGKLCLTWSEFIKLNKKKISHVNELVPFTRRIRIIDNTRFLMAAGLSYDGIRLDTVTTMKVSNSKSNVTDAPTKKSKKKPKVDPTEIKLLKPNMGVRGYRYIESIFQFIDMYRTGFGCELIRWGCSRIATAKKNKLIQNTIGVVCTGVNVEYKTGSHAFTADCRMMESKTVLDVDFVTDPDHVEYDAYVAMMDAFRLMDKTIYKAVCVYYLTMKAIKSMKSTDIAHIESTISDCKRKWWLYVDTWLYPIVWGRINREFAVCPIKTKAAELVGEIIETELKSAKSVVRSIINESLPTITAKEIEAISHAEQQVNYFTTKKKDGSDE